MFKSLLTFIFLSCFLTHALSAKTEVKAIVFDFGGVVANADRAPVAEFLMHSFQINENELNEAFQDMRDDVKRGGSEKEFWEQYAAAKGRKLPSDWLDQFQAVIKQAMTEMPETLAIVRELREQGYMVALLSDMTQMQATVIRKMKCYDLFQPILLSYETGAEKPEAEAFKMLLKELNLQPSAVIFIDDKRENVEGARSLGIDAIQFENARQLKKELEKRGFDLSQIEAEAFCIL